MYNNIKLHNKWIRFSVQMGLRQTPLNSVEMYN